MMSTCRGRIIGFIALGSTACSAGAIDISRGRADPPADSGKPFNEEPEQSSGDAPDAGLVINPSGSDAGSVPCAPVLIAVVRDFDASHADFEHGALGEGSDNTIPFIGLVEPSLSAGVPRLSQSAVPNRQITSSETFSQWYGVDHPSERTHLFDFDSGLLKKSTDENGNTVYESSAFFPLDNVVSQEPRFVADDGLQHNFHFTLELNTTFIYNGGETFTFRGDDDLWVFIDEHLVVDLGGLHLPVEGSVALDSLGLTMGRQYPLSIFHAERHTSQSNFKVTTSLEFTNCDAIVR
jgi:fibro-slime domain-containing protein